MRRKLTIEHFNITVTTELLSTLSLEQKRVLLYTNKYDHFLENLQDHNLSDELLELAIFYTEKDIFTNLPSRKDRKDHLALADAFRYHAHFDSGKEPCASRKKYLSNIIELIKYYIAKEEHSPNEAGANPKDVTTCYGGIHMLYHMLSTEELPDSTKNYVTTLLYELVSFLKEHPNQYNLWRNTLIKKLLASKEFEPQTDHTKNMVTLFSLKENCAVLQDLFDIKPAYLIYPQVPNIESSKYDMTNKFKDVESFLNLFGTTFSDSYHILENGIPYLNKIQSKNERQPSHIIFFPHNYDEGILTQLFEKLQGFYPKWEIPLFKPILSVGVPATIYPFVFDGKVFLVFLFSNHQTAKLTPSMIHKSKDLAGVNLYYHQLSISQIDNVNSGEVLLDTLVNNAWVTMSMRNSDEDYVSVKRKCTNYTKLYRDLTTFDHLQIIDVIFNLRYEKLNERNHYERGFLYGKK